MPHVSGTFFQLALPTPRASGKATGIRSPPNNAAQYYPDYAFNHPLFTPGMKMYSDSRGSSFLNSITDDQTSGFLNRWNEKRNHRERIYISYDSTNKNCQAGDLEIAEYGHAKDDRGKPVFNYSLSYDHNKETKVCQDHRRQDSEGSGCRHEDKSKIRKSPV